MIDLIKNTMLFLIVFITLELGPHKRMPLLHVIIAALAVLLLTIVETQCNSEGFSELPLKPAEEVIRDSATTSESQLPLKPAEQVLKESVEANLNSQTQEVSNVAVQANLNSQIQTVDSSSQITMVDVQNLIDRKIRQISNSYLNQPEYQTKDSDYYTNTGDLVDRSWDNQYTLLDTKYWKPYVPPPPLCIGRNEPCDSCPTINHMPYLELKNFDNSRKVFT